MSASTGPKEKQRMVGKESPAASPPSLQLSLQFATLSEIGTQKKRKTETANEVRDLL